MFLLINYNYIIIPYLRVFLILSNIYYVFLNNIKSLLILIDEINSHSDIPTIIREIISNIIL